MDSIGNVRIESPTAPELVLDLLMAEGGELSAETLCRAGALFCIGAIAVRVALTRLRAAGKIVRRRRGVYAIDPAGTALLRAIDDWRQRHVRTRVWGGNWLAVDDSAVLRSDKTPWRRHSLALALRGFAALRPTLHLRPDNFADGLVAERARLRELGLSTEALVFRLDGLDAPAQRQATALWNVRRLAAEHRALGAALTRSRRRLQRRPIDEALRESLLLGRTAIAYLLRDPVLPAEMMPPASRIALVDATTRYQAEALRLWRRWYARPDG